MLAELLQQLLRSRLALVFSAITVVGLLAAAVGRLIPWGWFFLTLLFLVVVVLVAGLLRQWWARRKDASLEAGLDAQGQRAVGQARVRDREQVKALQSRWKEQVEALRKSKIGRQKRWLYHLPWYVIIGAPASGKTTAINNSGLRFPMGQPKLSGTGGTKNCDWWFAEEAIILDTAGRYTFSEDNEPDREEWLEFLKLLRKYRPAAPINGLIAAVSADTLLGKEPDVVAEEARHIRHKLDQLVAELGIQFPVYVLVTKCDLIEGFTEFFSTLPKARLDEMLGWTNPTWETADPKKLVGEAMGALRERVGAMRPGLLWEEDRRDRLRAVYLFPEELGAFERSLEEFADVLFRETMYNESPFLRGIFLTSGLQTGTTVSKMLDRLGMRVAATQLREEKRSFFLKDFFKTRLPADRNLVATTGKTRGRLQIVNNVGLAVIAAVCVLFATVTGGSYVANRTLLNDLEDEMRAAKAAEAQPPVEKAAAIDRYVGVIEALEARNRRIELSARWGLWTGDRAIEPARALFISSFERDAYLPPTDAARKLLRDRDPVEGFTGLEALIRNYVLSKLLNGTTAQPPGPNDTLAALWAKEAAPNDELLARYARGYFAYLRWRPADKARADESNDLVLLRQALPEMYTVERVADWADRVFTPLRAQEIPVPAAIANQAEVRGAFRPEAWSRRVELLTNAVEEIAPEIDKELVPRFRQEYRRRYDRAWLDFLMRPKEDAATPASTLLGEQTPYLAIVDKVAAAAPVDMGTGGTPEWAKTVVRVDAERAPYLQHLAAIDRHLKAGRSDPPAALQDAKGIFGRAAAIVSDPAAEPPPDPFGKAERFVSQLVNKGTPADGDDAQVRQRLEVLLAAPVYAAFREYLAAVGEEIDLQWSRQIASLPAQTVPQLQALYQKPGGAVWNFYEQVLQPFYEAGGYQRKIRYRASLQRNVDFLKTVSGKLADAVKAEEEKTKPRKLFFTSVPSGPGEGGVLPTRTMLRVHCGDGEPWTLEHRQFRKSQQLTWSMDGCGRAEVAVWVGTSPDDERPLSPLGAENLPSLLREASREGGAYVWRFPGGVTAVFEMSPPGIPSAPSGGGGAPPARLPRG